MKEKLTNKLDLPDPVVKAVDFSDYDRVGDISVTELIDSPRVKQLKRDVEVEIDVTDKIWALFGTAVHNVLERVKLGNHGTPAMHKLQMIDYMRSLSEEDMFSADKKAIESFIDKAKIELEKEFNKHKHDLDRYVMEKRMVHEVDGMKLSGKFDIYDTKNKVLSDYKVTSVWSIIFGDKWQWDAQENTYAWMMKKFENMQVDIANIVAILRDYSPSRAQRENNYPESQVTVVPVPLLPMEKMDAYVYKKIAEHKRAKIAYDEGRLEDLPKCRPRDRWYKEGKLAVYKGNSKKASKLFNESETMDAEKYAENMTNARIEFRPGENVRCEKYCPAVSVCSQAKELGVKAANPDK